MPATPQRLAITVTLDFTYDKGMLSVQPSIKSKLPEPERSGATIFWIHEGALSTQHPSQIDLEEVIRETPKPAAAAAG